MLDGPQQRIRIEERNGIRVYSAGFWPGWREVISLSLFGIFISAAFGVLFYIARNIQTIYREFFCDILDLPWLDMLFNGFLMSVTNFTLILGFAFFLTLWIPYFLIYCLSPKRYWIENDTLFHTAYLLGFIPNKRNIPFEQILDVQAKASNGKYAVTVLYERSLPKWLFVILVYWNENLTKWVLTLINGIPTMEEAQKLQTALLEPMTDSVVCRVGTEPTQSPKQEGPKA